MDYHPASGLMIVTFLRVRPGVPITLGAFCTTDYPTAGSSPKIWRFPNPFANELRSSDFEFITDKDGLKKLNPLLKPDEQWDDSVIFPDEVERIISVYQVTIDEKCNRVYFVDNGQVTYNLNTTYVMQKPALVVVELPTDGCSARNFPIIRRAEFPDGIAAKGSDGFSHIALDHQPGDSCDDLFLYIPNIFHKYLTVYDYKENEFWTIEHETFQPVIAESNFIFDETLAYDLALGPLSIALGHADENGEKTVYYASIASTGLYAVSTKVLRDKSKSNEIQHSEDFRIIGYRGCDHQILKTIIDDTHGVMFFSEVQSNQIRCWNMSKPLNSDNIGVVYESKDLKFGLQMFIDSLGYLWFHSTRLPLIYKTDLPLNLDEVNSRIFRVKVTDAIRGTICVNEQEV
ncbi:L-dopachrome tautomerase yellow-f2-like [Lutzomyia longipalpis]|uniref:L-dopachrome tautomerase yellow-f2-like n=1 Tax=Lutzomyia longipalpis TaxID=7200 RepID=UPI002483D0A2|nr:L-dopachrome tautomerase yellow-f2-like [Lutzomyia longipalpis]